MKNKKGFKVVNNVAAIQGDGINHEVLKKILDAVLAEGYSAQCVAFGMGAGLLQKVNRDTMSFATKLSYIEDASGEVREVMKKPKTDKTKFSLPGITKVVRDAKGVLTILPRGVDEEVKDNELKVVYDMGPVEQVWETFDEIKARVAKQWPAVPKVNDPISKEMYTKIENWIAAQDKQFASLYGGK